MFAPESSAPAGSRIPAAERRELILGAATEVIGARGYVGATTDLVAKAAGISQPYVVRMFGTKEQLFVEVIDRALDALLAAFRGALNEHTWTAGSRDDLAARLGAAYIDLIKTRGIHLSLLQSFVQGSDPVIGGHARRGFLQIWALLRDEAGLDADEAQAFLAHGMLISVLLAVRMPDVAGTEANELLQSCFGHKLPMVLAMEHATPNDGDSGPDSARSA